MHAKSYWFPRQKPIDGEIRKALQRGTHRLRVEGDRPRVDKMKEALALAPGGSIAIDGIGERLAFVGFPSKRAAKQISGSAEDALKGIAALLEQMIVGAVEQRTAAEFKAAYDGTFQSYAQLMNALGSLIRAVVPVTVRERVTAESLCEMEADFRDHALVAFGANMRDQALFTVWTLRKISDIAQRIWNKDVSPDLKDQDSKIAAMFVYHGVRTRFHLDCLFLSMRTNRPIYPEVLEVISDGLRSAVDAYAWIRQAADLRSPHEEPILEFIDMDEDDKIFVDSSAFDMAKECPVDAG